LALLLGLLLLVLLLLLSRRVQTRERQTALARALAVTALLGLIGVALWVGTERLLLHRTGEQRHAAEAPRMADRDGGPVGMAPAPPEPGMKGQPGIAALELRADSTMTLAPE